MSWHTLEKVVAFLIALLATSLAVFLIACMVGQVAEWFRNRRSWWEDK